MDAYNYANVFAYRIDIPVAKYQHYCEILGDVWDTRMILHEWIYPVTYRWYVVFSTPFYGRV